MDIPDEVMANMTFAMPWQYDEGTGTRKDPDGFPTMMSPEYKEDMTLTRKYLQTQCWDKFQKNPIFSTAVRGQMGRITGMGFECSSEVKDIQATIDDVTYDWRNRLYLNWPKYVARAIVEGELFLLITVHENGFTEVDFVDPTVVDVKGDDGTGIIWHPDKALMPLFYNIRVKTKLVNSGVFQQIPSIYVARFPEYVKAVKSHMDFNLAYQSKSISKKKAFKKLGGYYRFIVSWDKGFMTRRTIGYLRTTIEWLNHYENLKKYEIDHKKSAGAYVWTVQIEDPRTFKLWLSLSDDERRKTGIMAKKTPGSTLVLPPGCSLAATYPQLSKIKEEDTDILGMITAGLNEPEDIATGATRAPYAGVKASRGPYSDRTSDEISYFDRFLKYDFWAGIFYLKSQVSRFPTKFKVREATSFDEKGEPKFEEVSKKPEFLVDVSFPISEVIDYDKRAKGLLGTKHGPVSEQIGVPNSEVARRMGFGGYGRLRLRKATEDERYPELKYAMGVDAESLQETVEGEPGKPAKQKKLVQRQTKTPKE